MLMDVTGHEEEHTNRKPVGKHLKDGRRDSYRSQRKCAEEHVAHVIYARKRDHSLQALGKESDGGAVDIGDKAYRGERCPEELVGGWEEKGMDSDKPVASHFH